MNNKPIVMISFRENGENGGPFVSHKRIMESRLSEKYQFVPLIVPKGHLGIFNLKVIKQLKNDILKTKPDIVHFSGLQLEGFHIALACKLAKVKNSIVAVHGSTSEAINFSKFKKFVIHVVESITLRITDTSYGISKYVSSWSLIKKNSKKHIGYIYNMPFAENEKTYNKKNIREELNIGYDEIVIVSTGRITEEKGFKVLCQVIKSLQINEKVRFIIAGDGEYFHEMSKELEREIQLEKVFLLGYRSDIDVILSGSNIFVICSLHETLCISLLEAAQHGLALVATNVGGIPEIIVNNFNGFLTEINDVNSVKIALNELINDHSKMKQFGLNAKITINSKFSRESIIDQIDNLYRRVLNNDKKSIHR